MILINIFFIEYLSMDYIRPLRAITTFSFSLLFVFFKGYRYSKLAIAFMFFFLSDLFIIKYDKLVFNNLTSVVRTLGYLFIGLHLLPKFKVEIESKRALAAYLIAIFFCAIMFYELIDIMSLTFKDMVHRYLYFSYSLILLGLLILVGNYNFRYNSTQSTSCMYFTFSFVISDLFAFISYYLEIDAFYYPTRIFYILGLAALTAYAVLPFQREVLYKDDSLDIY
ncbi:hypothetical protein [uncultured Formosa sp.]|uniref:hypothetical protein n=1 Tax=uncultured Formosa sp. TaxID=255435 RepID=UPI002611AB16|nr:hypothetical protein [uncultured Formosa sp.]